jgi:hypothetical protein
MPRTFNGCSATRPEAWGLRREVRLPSAVGSSLAVTL